MFIQFPKENVTLANISINIRDYDEDIHEVIEYAESVERDNISIEIFNDQEVFWDLKYYQTPSDIIIQIESNNKEKNQFLPDSFEIRFGCGCFGIASARGTFFEIFHIDQGFIYQIEIKFTYLE